MADELLHLQADVQLAVAESDAKNQAVEESDELSQAKSDDQEQVHHQHDLAVSAVSAEQLAQCSRLAPVPVAELLAVA